MTITFQRAHQIALTESPFAGGSALASFPVPARVGAREPRYRCFYYAVRFRHQARDFEIYPPAFVLEILADGTQRPPIRVTPELMGLPGRRDAEPLGVHGWPAGRSAEELEGLRYELYPLLDAAMQLWLADVPAERSRPRLRRAREILLDLVERPLLPCYRALGAHFCAWLGV